MSGSVLLKTEGPDAPLDYPRGSRRSIKMVTCIIRPEKLNVVTDSVNKLNLVGGMTVTNVGGVGHEKPFSGARYQAPLVSRVQVDLAIEADDVAEVERLVAELSRTGEVGDGKIIVCTVKDAMRIRTGERGASAL
jgi:nitrogen regulatory protein P-II 1